MEPTIEDELKFPCSLVGLQLAPGARMRAYLWLYSLDELGYLGLSEPRFSVPWFVVR
jgi:hypothetical protein